VSVEHGMDRRMMVKQFLGHVANPRGQRFRVFTTGDEKYYLLDPLIPGTDCSGCVQFPVLRRVLNQRLRAKVLRRVL
jgi:hypothetical protein